MVGNVTIQGQIVGTATFDGAKISAVVTIAPPINATVVFGKSGVTVHNELTGRDAVDVHPKESVTGLKKTDSPEFANTQITTLKSLADGGIIPTAEATWLGATAKSVLSYLQKLVSKVYAINSRVEVLENDVIFSYTTVGGEVEINATVDIADGEIFDIIMSSKSATDNTLTAITVNNIESGYHRGTSIINYVQLYTFGINFLCVCNCFFVNKEILFHCISGYQVIGLGVAIQQNAAFTSRTINANLNNVSKITFRRSSPYPPGVVIKIKKT